MGISDYLTCLLRNLYAGQEATVKTGHGTMNWFKIGEGVHQGCILSPCLFNLYAEYIMQTARLDEAQAGIKIDGKNINNLRYAVDAILMAESGKAPKSLLMKWKEESEKAGLKLNIWKMKIITSHQSEWPSSKSLQTVNAGEGVEQREPSCTAGGIDPVTMEDSMETPLKTSNKITIWPRNPTPRHIPWGNQNWKKTHEPQCSLQHYLQ